MSSKLTPLPGPTSFSAVASGTVVLFKDNNWGSKKWTININDYREGVRQVVDHSLFDEATWVLYNLPEGVVMTLTDNVKTDTNSPFDWSDCGRVADLVGNGTTRAVDLVAIGMNDIVSSFVWRHVDFSIGAIELFVDANFSGHRATVFLSEWSAYDIHSISSWALQDAISSIRWKALNDRSTVTMYEHADGKGSRYDNITGYGNTKEIANLKDVRFNDTISSFSWTPMNPKKEIVQPVQISSNGIQYTGGLTSVQNGTNSSSEKQVVTVSLTDTKSQTITVTTTDQYTAGVKYTYSQSATVGVKDVASATVTTSLELSFQYSHTDTTSRSDTETIAINITQQATIPANSTYTATLTAQMGQINDQEYHTTATRWYDVPVVGGVQDSTNNNWYKRDENVTIRIKGAVALNWNLYVKAVAI